MSGRDRYMPGVPCWVDTSQPDPEAAVRFYGELFGWQFEDVTPPGSGQPYFVARQNGGDVAAVSSAGEGGPPAATWNTYVWVESAGETAEKARAAGGTVLVEPFDVMDSGRMAVLADTEGAAFSVWEAREHRGATVVNEPVSLNFNDLNSRDLDAARAFYGAVFGWQAIDMGGGFSMWTLPGYGDLLEELNPGTRANMEQMGAPDGFVDVVASLNPIPADQPDTPPHWGVTFAVADADDIAGRAAELGATVLVPPMDAPWVRTTVISDPQGATFVASKFVPENRDLPADAGAAVSGA